MDEQDHFLRTVEGLYSAVADDTHWEQALLGVAHFVGGHAAFYLASHPTDCKVLSSTAVGVDPQACELLLGPYASKEVRIEPALRVPVGQIVVDRGLLDWRDFCRSEIYNELCLPYDVPNLMAVWLKKTPRLYVSLSIEASNGHGEFTRQETQRFSRLTPHLVRAYHARELMVRARQAKRLNDEVLEMMPFGVISLDFAGAVIEMTALASRALSEDSCLIYRGESLHARHPEDDKKLRGLIHSALHWREGRVEDAGEVAVAMRRPGRRPLLVVAVPLASADIVYASMCPSCLLLLIDPDRRIPATAEMLRRTLDISAAEARLAARLFHGDSLADAARQLRVSYNTCKTQMRSIYDKTGCTSQIELAKKIMLIAWIDRRRDAGPS